MPSPNLVFLFADQMRAQATGYAGDPNVRTPYLDTLADQSLNFINATSTCPICTPYRACLLTGQYPLTHGLFMNDLCLPDNGHSLGQELRRGGYDTGWIGKWHLDGHGRSNPIPPERRQGFDHWQALESAEDWNHSQYYQGNEPTPRIWDGYDAYAQAQACVDYIEGREDADRPFALFLSFNTPHDPYDAAPADLKALYPVEALTVRENVAPHRQDMARKQLRGYYAHITAIDRCIERIDAALARAGLQDDTILVFTSDHGDMIESHWHRATPGRGPRKQCPYDESVLVPLLLRYPARYGRTGRAVIEPIGSADLMPTLLGLCGLETPLTVEGMDFGPVVDGVSRPDRQGVLIANYHPFADWRTAQGGRPYRGLRTRRHTFVRDRNGPWLLFDNEADPLQLHNRVNTSDVADVQRRLDAELADLLRRQGDAFEAPEALRHRWGYRINDRESIPYTW